VFDGLTNKQIAEAIHVSEGAVKATVQQLFHKAQVRTRAQLVRLAADGALVAATQPETAN
jgi:DNA-binding NarL/FixJ family response regulator